MIDALKKRRAQLEAEKEVARQNFHRLEGAVILLSELIDKAQAAQRAEAKARHEEGKATEEAEQAA